MNLVLLALTALSLDQAPPEVRKLTIDDCVREALGNSGQMMEARGKIREWEGRLKEGSMD
jgi:hypothetical protein